MYGSIKHREYENDKRETETVRETGEGLRGGVREGGGGGGVREMGE